MTEAKDKIAELKAAVVGFAQMVALYHGAHGAIENQYSVFQQFPDGNCIFCHTFENLTTSRSTSENHRVKASVSFEAHSAKVTEEANMLHR